LYQATPAAERTERHEGADAPDEYFRVVVQTLPDATLMLDESFHVRDETPSVAELLGRSTNDLRGQNLLSLVHPDNGPGAAAFLSHATTRPGTTAPTEWRVRHSRGHWSHLEVVCNNLLDDERLRFITRAPYPPPTPETTRAQAPRKSLRRPG
jgi:PAS domain S-box-containing protein